MSKFVQPKISAKEYRAYVEGKGGIAALMPKPASKNPPKKGETKRSGKYNARGRTVNGVWMASEAQAKRYEQLLVLEGLGLITRLRTEVPFILRSNGVHICTYRADFEYVVVAPRAADEYCVIEDVKGMVLPEYKLKKKLMSANGTAIFEIPAKDVDQWNMRLPLPPT